MTNHWHSVEVTLAKTALNVSNYQDLMNASAKMVGQEGSVR